ncbi:MAG: DUF4860 domain-containing protein [Ruminiclostridium sp.]|nr:DUF4860 domain-containing protein [Ruminiclostridium sp.]
MFRNRLKTVKSNRSGMDTIFVMTVFLLFVCCLLATVLAFTKAYKHFGSSIEQRFDTATAQTLVLRKLMSYDCRAVDSGEYDGIEFFSFADEFDGEEYTTYIYAYGGQLRELFLESGRTFAPDDGNILLPADSFSASIDGDTAVFTIEYNGSVNTTHYYLRSGKAVAV